MIDRPAANAEAFARMTGTEPVLVDIYARGVNDGACEKVSPEALAQLRPALDAGWRSVEAARFRPADELVAEFRARRLVSEY